MRFSPLGSKKISITLLYSRLARRKKSYIHSLAYRQQLTLLFAIILL